MNTDSEGKPPSATPNEEGSSTGPTFVRPPEHLLKKRREDFTPEEEAEFLEWCRQVALAIRGRSNPDR